MTFLIRTCLSLCFPMILQGQVLSIDSLKTSLSHSLDDSVRSLVLNQVAWEYRRVNLDSMKHYANLGLEFAQKHEFTIREIQATITLGNYFRSLRKLDSAKHHFETAYELAKNIDNLTAQAAILNNMAIVNRMRGDYEMALDNYQSSIRIKQNLNDVKGVLTTQLNLVMILYDGKQYYEIISLAEAILDNNEIDKYPLIKARAINALGTALLENEKFPEAESQFRKALKLFKKYDMKFDVPMALNNLGLLYYRQNMLDTAKEYLKSAIEFHTNNGQSSEVDFPLLILSRVYLKQKRFEESISALDRAKEILKKYPNLSLEVDLYQYYGDIYEAKGDYSGALRAFNKWLVLKDSLVTIEQLKTVESLKLEFETAQKDNEILQLTNERQAQEIVISRTRTTQYALGGALVALLLLGGFFWKDRQRRILLAKYKAEEAEKNRIARELHDGIANEVLNIGESLPEQAGALKNRLLATDQELRKFAHQLSSQRKFESPLHDILNDYLGHNIGTRLKVKIDFFPRQFDILDQNLKINVFRVWQELIANTLKHSHAANSFLQLAFLKKKIELTYRDDGNGLPEATESTGMGLNNIRERISLFKGDLHFTQAQEGFEVKIDIPVKKSQIAYT